MPLVIAMYAALSIWIGKICQISVAKKVAVKYAKASNEPRRIRLSLLTRIAKIPNPSIKGTSNTGGILKMIPTCFSSPFNTFVTNWAMFKELIVVAVEISVKAIKLTKIKG